MKKLPHNPVPSHADFAAIGRDAIQPNPFVAEAVALHDEGMRAREKSPGAPRNFGSGSRRPGRSKRRRHYVKKLTVQIGGVGGTILKFRDRSAWALLSLIEAGRLGVAPFERPAPRWSLYVSIFRQKGLAIETVFELYGGPYPGRRGRYVLRSLIEIIDREDAA
jgi:hypothetical protein